MTRLVTVLDAACVYGPAPRAAQIDAAITRALSVESHARQPAPRYWGEALRLTRRRLISLAAALLVALSGVLGYQQLHGTPPASAQSVLSRAAAAMRLAPYQATHLTYSVALASPGGKATTSNLIADVWVEADASGVPAMSAQTLADSYSGGSARSASGNVRGRPLAHYIQIGQLVYGFYGPNNEIVIPPGVHDEHPAWMAPVGALDGAGATEELSTLAQHSPRQVHLLSQQLLDGTTVDVVQVDGWTDAPAMRTTFYFDAQSFLLRGFDAASIDLSYPTPSWQVRLTGYRTVAASAIPSRTFMLDAPAEAQVEVPRPDLSVVATVCHSTADFQKILQAGTQSLLAACRATAPSVSRDDLVAALMAANTAKLAAATAAGQITTAQEAAGLASQRQSLDTFVTIPGGGGVN
jgi:hypothetical protein